MIVVSDVHSASDPDFESEEEENAYINSSSMFHVDYDKARESENAKVKKFITEKVGIVNFHITYFYIYFIEMNHMPRVNSTQQLK